MMKQNVCNTLLLALLLFCVLPEAPFLFQLHQHQQATTTTTTTTTTSRVPVGGAAAASAVVASSKDDDPVVIIVGAGLAGLSLSLGLVKEGYKVKLVEKDWNFDRTGATFGLQGNGNKALRELLSDYGNDDVDDLEELGISAPNGGIMLGWWQIRDKLRKRVLTEQANDKIEVHMGWMIDEIVAATTNSDDDDDDDDDSVVTVRFRKRRRALSDDDNSDENLQQEEKEEDIMTLKGTVLVGADGVNSAVRGLLGLKPAKKVNIVTWRGRFTLEDDDDNNNKQCHQHEQEQLAEEDSSTTKEERTMEATPAATAEAIELLKHHLEIPWRKLFFPSDQLNYGLFNFHPKEPNTMAIVVNYQLRDDDDDDDVAEEGRTPQEIMGSFAKNDKEIKEIRAIMQLTTTKMKYPIRLKVIELPPHDGKGWGGKGRITLVGDAAHAMRPASGQGGSMAFEDNVILCRCLGKLLLQQHHNKKKKKGKPLPALQPLTTSQVERALQDYENIRLPRVRKLWNDQWERSESYYKNNIQMDPWTKEFEEWMFNGV